MLKWPLSLLSRLGAVALIGYIAWLGWENLGPRKPEIGPARQELAEKVIPNIVEDIRTSRGNIRQAALLHFSNDPTDYFTNTLRSTVEQRGVLDLRDRTVMEKARNLLNLRHPSYTATDAAVVEGRELDAQGVLYGAVHAFESYPGGSKIDVEVNLVDVSTGQMVFTKRYSTEASPTASVTAAMQEASQSFPWFQRLFGWLIAVLLLPVFTIAFIRAMVRKGSNKSNAFVLGVYTLADALLAWLLVGAALNSWFPVVVFIAAVAVALLYNIRIMTFALRLEEA